MRPLALVTGGQRRIGAAIAAALARAGHDLALHGHGDGGALDPALEQAIAESGAAAECFAAELADPDQVEGLVDRVAAAMGRPPAVLVNCASMFAWDTPDDASQRAMLDHYAVNAAAPALLTRAAARYAALEQPLVVVNILDQRIAQPIADQFSYTLSKLALAEMTPILARHHAPHTRICAVAPGLTLPTPEYEPGQMERLAALMPLDRLPAPADIAEAVLYLIAARSVTGQVIFVDGGAHLCRYERDFLFLARGA